jgi:UDP-arabinose 4-epimerase
LTADQYDEPMTRVLVTGGAGFIGSHTAKRLKQSGLEPVVLDDLSMGHEWAVKFGPFVRGSVADSELVKHTIREHEISAVIHFAASTYVGESVQNPRKYVHNNVFGTVSLLDAMLDAGVKRIVFSSTAATYGNPQYSPLDEAHPNKPINPYGESKYYLERVMHSYEVAYGLQWAALRYFNAAGADPDGELGEVHNPESHLIPLCIEAALGKRRLSVFGTDYPTPDGTAVRDYIHVFDLADAHIKALSYLEAGGASGAMNLGSGQGFSVLEVIRAVERVTGLPVPFDNAPRRAGDPPELVANPKKAKTALGWEPQFPELERIVETAWGFFKNR